MYKNNNGLVVKVEVNKKGFFKRKKCVKSTNIIQTFEGDSSQIIQFF